MSNYYYLAVGFFVAVCLVWVFFLAKDQWEGHKEKAERKMRDIAIEEVLKEREYTEALVVLKKYCDESQIGREGGGDSGG